MSRTLEAPAGSPPRRLIGWYGGVEGMVGVSYRHWLRLCDSGRAPWGIKLGGRRLWDEAELDRWIGAGCPRVRPTGRASR